MRIGELCAGYGGLGMGIQAVLGGHVAWTADNDPGCAIILEHQFPGVSNFGDITTTDWSAMKRAANRKLDDVQKQSAVQMYEAGLSLAQVAGYFGVTRQAMWD